MGKTFAAPGNYFTSWRCPRKLLKFVQEVSTSAVCFFAAAAGEPLLVLVSLSLSGVSLRLFGLLACRALKLRFFAAVPECTGMGQDKAKKAGSNSILHPVDNYSS